MESLLQLKTFIIGGLFVSLFVLERIFPYRTIKNPNRHLLSNITLWAINSFLASFLVIAITISFTELALDGVKTWRANFFPSPVIATITDLLIYDFYIYWWHRLNHRLPILWRFHRVHHLDENLDATTAVRFHVGEVILSAIWRMPLIVILAMPINSIIMAEILLLVCSLFQHSNINLPKKLDLVLQWVIVTPRWHFMHHEPDRRNTDSHYGNVLTIWDRIFFSRAFGSANPKMKHGLPNLPDPPIWMLLLSPFVSIKKLIKR